MSKKINSRQISNLQLQITHCKRTACSNELHNHLQTCHRRWIKRTWERGNSDQLRLKNSPREPCWNKNCQKGSGMVLIYVCRMQGEKAQVGTLISRQRPGRADFIRSIWSPRTVSRKLPQFTIFVQFWGWIIGEIFELKENRKQLEKREVLCRAPTLERRKVQWDVLPQNAKQIERRNWSQSEVQRTRQNLFIVNSGNFCKMEFIAANFSFRRSRNRDCVLENSFSDQKDVKDVTFFIICHCHTDLKYSSLFFKADPGLNWWNKIWLSLMEVGSDLFCFRIRSLPEQKNLGASAKFTGTCKCTI